jgi:hypothetical protein
MTKPRYYNTITEKGLRAPGCAHLSGLLTAAEFYKWVALVQIENYV